MKKIGFLLTLMLAAAMPVTHAPGKVMQIVGAAVLLLAVLFSTKTANGMTTAGISREVWEAFIQENLFPTNEFLLAMSDHSQYVDYKTVHSPQSGAAPNVQKNRVLGGGATNTNLRTDVTTDWGIDVYTTDPFLISNAEEVELSYDKMSSVLYEQEMAIRKVIADNILVDIAPTGTALMPDGVTTNANVLRSTGFMNNDTSTAVALPAYTTGATGNRLSFCLYDVRQAKKFLDKQNVPSEDRAMVMSPDAQDQIIADIIATKYRGSVNDVFDTKTGTVTKLMGFTFYMRSQVCQYNNAAGTPVVKAVGAAPAVDDNDAILFFQKAFVARAIGDVHVYDTPNSAVYYGDVYSALVRMGATKLRLSELGVGAIVQAPSA